MKLQVRKDRIMPQGTIIFKWSHIILNFELGT